MKLELSIFYERRAKTKENGKTAETNTNNREGKKNSNRENDQILMICFLFIVTTIDHVASTHGSKDQ